MKIGRRDGAVLFRVRDDGEGIDAADREKIFEPGWRGEAALTTNRRRRRTWSRARPAACPRAAGGDVQFAGNGRGGDFAARLPAGLIAGSSQWPAAGCPRAGLSA